MHIMPLCFLKVYLKLFQHQVLLQRRVRAARYAVNEKKVRTR